jgi:GPI-anchor transamidase subunit GAA1
MAPNTAAVSLPALPAFNPARLRSYLLRLPLFTRGIIVAILFFWVLEFQTVWSVTEWGSLIPKEIGIGSSTSEILPETW